MDLIPLESNLHKKNHPVIISQIINMIESDNFWHRRTFESVMSNLRNMWTEGMQELENAHMDCTNKDENNNEMDGIEVIDLCSVNRCKNNAVSEGKESAKQESQDKSKHDETDRKVVELMTVKDESTTKKDIVASSMMCWEPTESSAEEEPHDEPEKVTNKPVETTKNLKHEEEHVGPTLDTSNQLKISIEEFCWEKEDNGSTLETEEHEPPELVYITNLKDGLQKNGTKLHDEEGPDKKKPVASNRLIGVPSLNNLNHEFDIYGETGMKDGWQMNGRWKEGGLMIELFKTTRTSMKFDRMIPSGSSWLMGIKVHRILDQAHSVVEPGNSILLSKFHQITGHTAEHLL